MPYKFENELREKASSFITSLIQAGIEVEPFPVMFRDYNVKLEVQRKGYINIYYSPKKDAFSIKLHELRDKSLQPVIETYWQNESTQVPVVIQSKGYQAYVDGSYIEGYIGYGAVILYQSQEIRRFSGSVEHHIEQRQIVGELQATIEVLAWCKQNNIVEIEISYDYEGIQKWATGEWRANNEVTKHYKQIVNNTRMQVIWNKVKSHTGIHWNEIADQLAKEGALKKKSESETKLDDPMEILEQTAFDFVKFLTDQNIDAKYTQIHNEQYARIKILDGYFDLYNTQKRPMSPYIHNFKDTDKLRQIEKLWKQFYFEIADDLTDEMMHEYEEIEYYLSIFEPYRNLSFNFSELAKSLQPFVDTSISLPTDNYNELEQIYKQLSGQNNG